MKITSLNKILFLILLSSLAFFLNNCGGEEGHGEEGEHGKHWSYDGETGPKYWAELNENYDLASRGKNQSPIDLETAEVIYNDLPNIRFEYEPSKVEVVNNGHTIEAELEKGNYIEIGEDRYDLFQFHFHSYSEHTVNGKHYPLEVHFVHKNAYGDLAVIGLFVIEGKSNEEFEPIWENLPALKGLKKELHRKINPFHLLPEEKVNYEYNGSLTTPPCSEGVRWFVLSNPVQMSKEQIDAFRKIYDHNYRPTQPKNARQVLFDVK